MTQKHQPIEKLGLMTVDEAIRFTTLSRAKIYRLMDEGDLRYVKIGRARRILRQSAHDLILNNLAAVNGLTTANVIDAEFNV